MSRKKNSEAIVQIIVLIGTALLLLGGMLSGKVNYYIHPRYHIGIWVSIGVLFLFAIRLSADLKKARHNANLKSYMLFAVPILIAVVFPASGITGSGMAIAGSNPSNSPAGSQTSDGDRTAQEESYEEDDNVDYTNNPNNNLTSSYDGTDYDTQTPDTENFVPDDVVLSYDNMSDKYKGETIDGATVIEGDYFASWFYDLYDYLDDFKGKRYQFLAQVYPSDEFGENRFLAGRYIMVCCAADASGYGIICESDKSGELKENEWIIVTGTVAEYDYNGTKIPMLTDTVITKTDAPEEEYVYYNFY